MAFELKAGFVDLGYGSVEVKEVCRRLMKLYLGGRGLNMSLLYNLLEPGIDPLGPENVLLVGTGLFAGIPAPEANCTHIGGKSPLTGLAGSSHIGGFFGPEIRFAGFDHLIVSGKATGPVYLWVHNGEIEIRDASRIWGADFVQAQTIIREEMDDEDIKIISIGVDGENFERFASIRSGVKDCVSCIGMGSLMGSKNLKAIAVRGTLPIEIADPEGFLKHQQEVIEFIQSSEYAHIMDRSWAGSTHDETHSTGLVHLRNLRVNQPPASGEDKNKSWTNFCKECLYALVDTLGICKFDAVSLSPIKPVWDGASRIIELLTGLKYTPGRLMEAGERIYNIERLFNIREGATRADDTLPEWFLRWIITSSTERDRVMDLEKSERLLDEYYESHGWDKEGRPTPETLKYLGLDQEPKGLF